MPNIGVIGFFKTQFNINRFLYSPYKVEDYVVRYKKSQPLNINKIFQTHQKIFSNIDLTLLKEEQKSSDQLHSSSNLNERGISFPNYPRKSSNDDGYSSSPENSTPKRKYSQEYGINLPVIDQLKNGNMTYTSKQNDKLEVNNSQDDSCFGPSIDMSKGNEFQKDGSVAYVFQSTPTSLKQKNKKNGNCDKNLSSSCSLPSLPSEEEAIESVSSAEQTDSGSQNDCMQKSSGSQFTEGSRLVTAHKETTNRSQALNQSKDVSFKQEQHKGKDKKSYIFSCITGSGVGLTIAYFLGAAALTSVYVATGTFIVMALAGALIAYGIAKLCENKVETKVDDISTIGHDVGNLVASR